MLYRGFLASNVLYACTEHTDEIIKEYFINGQTWGDRGIQEVIEDIYKLNKREEILNKFIREAIKKIRIKDSDQFQQKLPPYYQND